MAVAPVKSHNQADVEFSIKVVNTETRNIPIIAH
jgi:hypothetical protein